MKFGKKIEAFIRGLKVKYFYPKYFKYISADDYFEKYKETSRIYHIQNGIKVFVFSDMNIIGGSFPPIIYKNRKEILVESFFYKSHAEVFFPRKRKALSSDNKKCIFVDKLCNFARVWNNNYWHFTFQALPIIFAFENQGYDGKYLVFDNNYTKELLDLIGVPKDRILYFEKNTVYKVKECHVVEALGSDEKYVNIIKDMRDKILSNIDDLCDNNYPKNIFVNRTGTRKIKNLDEVNEILKKYDFKTIIPDGLSVKEQIKYFYNADVVLSPHGANSTNSIYMKKGSNFIETFGRLYVNPCCLPALKLLDIRYLMITEHTALTKAELEKLDLEPFSDYEAYLLVLELYLKSIMMDKELCSSHC